MKKLFGVILLVFICLTVSAVAEEDYSVGFETEYRTDLDGDGTIEIWSWYESDDGLCRLGIESEVGLYAPVYFDIDPWIWHDLNLYAIDLDSNGITELFCCLCTSEGYGYTTYCLRYINGEIEEVMFKSTNRNSDAYFFTGTGKIKGFDGNKVILRAWVNVLGSWIGNWSYTIGERDMLIPENEGWCTREFSSWDEESTIEEYWNNEYAPLTLKTETAFIYEDEICVLYPDDRIMITGTDHVRSVSFVTEDGKEGYLQIYSDPMNDPTMWYVDIDTVEELTDSPYGNMNLVKESELFKFLPYGG